MDRDAILSQVRTHIEQAASLLRSMGKEYERAAWLVEDTTHFIAENSSRDDESGKPGGVPWQDFSYEDEPLQKNGTQRG